VMTVKFLDHSSINFDVRGLKVRKRAKIVKKTLRKWATLCKCCVVTECLGVVLPCGKCTSMLVLKGYTLWTSWNVMIMVFDIAKNRVLTIFGLFL
jgi:hypothetical protein